MAPNDTPIPEIGPLPMVTHAVGTALPAGDLIEELRLKIERLEFEAGQRTLTVGRQNTLIAEQTKTLADVQWRLTLSQSFGQLMVKAYTALQSYKVDYRKLRSYKNWDGIDYFNGSDEQRYREAITRFITEINHDIDAAIRRKTGIKEVDLTK
jgi:hypothetical protein